MTKLLYHWYEEPKHSIVWVNENKLKNLLKNNLQNLKRLPNLRVSTLYKILKQNRVEKERLEKLKIVGINERRLFPINLNRAEFYRIVSSILNEGNLKHDRDYFGYYNQELNLHKILNKNILKIFGFKLNEPKLTKSWNVFRSYSYGIIPRTLKKFGLKPGSKTIGNMDFPSQFNKLQPRELIPHFQQLMLEEMSTSLHLKKRDDKYYLFLQLRYGRSQEITKHIPKKVIENMEPNYWYRFSLLPNEIKVEIKKNKLKLIKKEQELLEKFNIKSWLRPSGIYKTKNNLVKVFWLLLIEEHNSIEKFYKMFVFNSPKLLRLTKKWRKMFRLHPLYKRLKGKQLNYNQIKIIKQKRKEWRTGM